MSSLLSVIESPIHPNFSTLYQRLGFTEVRAESMRKAISQIKRQPPDVIVCEFFYGYSNNYAGVNISNLDVMLYSLQKYAPDTRVLVLVDKSEAQHVTKLNEIFPVEAVLVHPVTEAAISSKLSS